MDLVLSTHQVDDLTVVSVGGEVDLDTASQLGDHALDAVRDTSPHVVLVIEILQSSRAVFTNCLDSSSWPGIDPGISPCRRDLQRVNPLAISCRDFFPIRMLVLKAASRGANTLYTRALKLFVTCHV